MMCNKDLEINNKTKTTVDEVIVRKSELCRLKKCQIKWI